MYAYTFFNTRGPSDLCLKFTLIREISPSLGQDGGGRYSSSQDASFSRSVYSITLSTEIIWNTYDISWVSIRGSCWCMYRDCKWNLLLLYGSEHPRSQHPQRTEVGVWWGLRQLANLFIIFNTFTYNYFLQFYIKAKRIREMKGQILLIHLLHLNKKQEVFLRKNTYGHQSVCVATEGPRVTDEQNWTVIKPHFNNQSLSTLLEERNGETSFLLFFSL